MDKSPEKSTLLSTKAHSLEAKTASPRQQFAHEELTTNAIFRPLKKAFPSQSTLENASKAVNFPSSDAVIGRNTEQFISSLQAQYYSPAVPTAALAGMSLPYGMIAGPGMDPRALNAGNLLYTYGNPVMSFPNFTAGYGQGQRIKNGEESTASDKSNAGSTQLRPTEPPSRQSKEPLRTESVIKTVTDKQEISRKSSDPDKRIVTDAQGTSIPLKYPDKGTGNEHLNSVDGNKGLSLRDSSLRDMHLRDTQGADDMPRRDKQSIGGDFDRSRDMAMKAKPYENLGVDSIGIKRPTNGLTSRKTDNGAVTFSSHDKSYVSSEARSSPYPANEPPTLVPYHNTLPPRSSASTSHSNVPCTMPKLTPIAPRISNGSPLTVPYSSEAEHRKSPSFLARRQNYPNSMNSVSSAPSVTVHSGGVVPWTGNFPSKPPQGDKGDENWRTKQNHREERDINRTSVYDPAPKQMARNFYPMQSWERAPYGAHPSQLRAVGVDKGFGGKEDESADSREVPRDSSREGMMSSEQTQAKFAKSTYKYGPTGPASVRKESDLPSAKISTSASQDEYHRNPPFVGRNEKSVVGEYVCYNKNEDGKGSLGNVIVHGKEGSFRLSVERREGGQKYLKPEITKPSRGEENRVLSGSYSNYEGREQSEIPYHGMSRAEVRSARDGKEKEIVDRARTLEPSRGKEQVMYKEHTGRKLDSRELSSMNDGKKNNDRNNNSTSLGAFPFFKYGPGSFPSAGHGEQMRFAERGTASDDKVFVPPNATLDMYERREQEMEKNGFKKTEFNAFPRNVEGSHLSNPNDEGSKRIDERRNEPRRDDVKPKMPTGRFEKDKRGGDAEEISSDENDDGARHVSRETISPDKRGQLRVPPSSDRNAMSPAAGAVRQRRLSSPLSEQRSVAAEQRNTTASNAHGASYPSNLQSRRIPSDGSDGHSRESGVEPGLEGLKNAAHGQFLRMDGGAAFPSPYFGPLLTPQGLSEAPFLLVDPASFYGTVYRPHMMEAAPQGMFPPGSLAADPVTGQLMMIPPEAYIPMVAAENAFMNPMMDPRYHGMWGMPGAIDEAQLQQFYQMMQPFQQQQQQQQQQQLLERSKQEFLLGKQGVQFPLSAYPFYFGDKPFEQQRKEEIQDTKSTEQQQKPREVKQEVTENQSKETAPRPKPEATTNQEHMQRFPTSRDSEHVQQQDTVNRREEKSKIDSRWIKEAHQKLTEKQNAVQAKLDDQGHRAKQFKEYLTLDPLSQFPFPGPPASFLRDNPTVNLTVPVTTTISAQTPEVDRKSVSPKTVSAAVTLSSLEKPRAQEPHWTGRLSPPAKNDARVVGSQSSSSERVNSPRLRPGAESTMPKEIVETPRRLEAQPNLVGERLVSRESRDLSAGQVPLQFPQKLMAFGNIASERLLKERGEQDLQRDRFEAPFRAYDRGAPVSSNEMPCSGPEKMMTGNFEGYIPRREHLQRVESYGEMMNSFVKSENERAEKGLHPVQVGLRESMASQDDTRAGLQTVIPREKLLPPEQTESDSDYEDDFRTKCELRRIASSFVPLKPDLENKENSTMFSLRPFRSEAERKQIRDNIDRLRSIAKRRNSKDRFEVFSRRSDVRSPTTILNGVTSAIGDVAGVESVEKEMRMKLAELQKRYREKVRELARLQPKYGVDDGNGKSTPVKRGPGRPRKRKYFGASSKGEKPSPVATADEDREGAESLPASGDQSPESNAVASESESLVSKESEPPKKKKRRSKQKSPVEKEGRGTATPTLGISPVELADFQVPPVKRKKPRKPSVMEEEPTVALSKSKPTNGKKKAAGSGKRRKEGTPEQQDTIKQQLVAAEPSAKELESDPDFMEPDTVTKNTKAKKPKPKKRARPKLTIDAPESCDGKDDDVMPLDSTCETPQAPTPTKGKKAKGIKKKRKSTTTTPPKEKFQFPEVTSQEESFSENSSISPNEIAKEVVATAARKQLEAQKISREMASEIDDDVFATSHDGRDGLSLLAQASFATADKSTKRKRSEIVPLSEDLSQKKRGRPKKDAESPLFESDTPVTTPKKKKKKKVQEEDSTKEPKKKKKKKKKDAAPKEEISEVKPVEVFQDEHPESPARCEQPEELEAKEPETSAMNEDSEQDEDVFRPASEVCKDARSRHSSTSTLQDGGDMKTSISSLLSEEWQPRRSERIFINSSVTTTNSSSSPLSPTGKGSEFSYTKKAKKAFGTKTKSSRSGSQGEEELGESDVSVAQKVKTKAKKKRGPGKAKKRLPSDEDYEPLKMSRRARSKSRLTIDHDDADEEEADELQENEEAREEGETDLEINVTDKMETAEETSEEKGLPDEDDKGLPVEGGKGLPVEGGKGLPVVGGKGLPVEGGKNETEVQLEVKEEEKMETEVSDDKGDVEMEVDEKEEAKSGTEETEKADAVEESEEKEHTEEVEKKEEKNEQEPSSPERPSSPVDVRFTFLVDELVEGSKLLVSVDSVFYPGRISTFNEPDLFGVVLDGERGRRPHWKSTEQLLSDAVKDIQPPSVKFLSIGTRVCAHWSPQYRCFYPGTVTEAPPDEKEVNGKIWIEFDDGDSGFFQLNEIRRIHPNFPVEEAESTPSLPEKRPRSSSLGSAQFTATRDMSSRLRAEENTSEFSSGNESSGEIRAKRRRLRGKRRSRDDSWQRDNDDRENSAKRGETFRSRMKEVEKPGNENSGSLRRVRDKSSDSQDSKLSDAQTKQKSSKTRGKTEANVESKEALKAAESTNNDLASNASAELKESEKEIHSSDSSLKTEGFENSSKRSSDKVRASPLEISTELSDQGEDSEANSDIETSKNEKGPRAGAKGSSRTSEKDLRRRSLTLNLNSSFRSTRTDGESPTREVVSTSQDEDSESYSDTFDESPLVENKSFQPRLGRRRRSELDRLHVDMKYSGPLWQWSGRNFQNKRKGKGKKIFYKAIVRGDETISVGDCAVFMSNPTKNLNLPYVGKIESMWEGCGGNMVVRVKWFYHPEETKPGRKPSDGKQSLYRSTHVDENDVQTISHKCEVLSPDEFKRRFQSLESPGTRTSLSDRVFCCIGSYDPNNETLQTEL